MSEDKKDTQTGPEAQTTGAAWQEVGRQFQIFGETLAAAVRASWGNAEHRRRMQDMQGSIEGMVRDLDLAIQDAAHSPEVQQARDEAKRAAASLRDASEQTAQEVRPHLLAALKQVNAELQKLTSSMENDAARQQPPEEKHT